MWNTSSIHPLHFGCSQNWLFSDTFRGFATLVSMSCWRSSIATRWSWNKWIDLPGYVTLLRWRKLEQFHLTMLWLWLDGFIKFCCIGTNVDQVVKDITDCHRCFMFSLCFCIFGDFIRDADIIWGIREWLSFLFTCENQLMLALLKEKHFQALDRWTLMTLQWLGQFMLAGCNLESQSLPLSFNKSTQAFTIPSIPLMQVTFFLDVLTVCRMHISSSSRPSTTLHIGWVPSRKGSLMPRIWNENARPWKASSRNNAAWRITGWDLLYLENIQMHLGSLRRIMLWFLNVCCYIGFKDLRMAPFCDPWWLWGWCPTSFHNNDLQNCMICRLVH